MASEYTPLERAAIKYCGTPNPKGDLGVLFQHYLVTLELRDGTSAAKPDDKVSKEDQPSENSNQGETPNNP